MIQESKIAIFTDRGIAFQLCNVALDSKAPKQHSRYLIGCPDSDFYLLDLRFKPEKMSDISYRSENKAIEISGMQKYMSNN